MVLSLLLLAVATAAADAASKNYHAYHYDMTTPLFTPDGRLLQVEYAAAATESSTPLVVIQLATNSDDETQQSILAMLTCKSAPTLQRRMVILQPPPLSSTSSSSICVAMSGVLCDSMALLRKAVLETQSSIQKSRLPSPLQMATSCANECHIHSFGGGIRPYGSTLLIAGMNEEKNAIHFYQTDPSGGILPISLSPPRGSKNKNNDKNQDGVVWIVGGSPRQQIELRKRIEATLLERGQDDGTVMDRLKAVAHTMQQVVEDENDVSGSRTRRKRNQRRRNRKQDENENNDDGTNDKQEQEKDELEVVLISPTLGCHRLSPEQLLPPPQQRT